MVSNNEPLAVLGIERGLVGASSGCLAFAVPPGTLRSLDVSPHEDAPITLALCFTS